MRVLIISDSHGKTDNILQLKKQVSFVVCQTGGNAMHPVWRYPLNLEKNALLILVWKRCLACSHPSWLMECL